MTEDEKLVKETWDKAFKYQSLRGREMVQFGPHTLADWQEAAYFTRQRLHEIAELEEEIAVISFWSESPKVDQTSMRRTLKRLTDWRDEKKRGMRGWMDERGEVQPWAEIGEDQARHGLLRGMVSVLIIYAIVGGGFLTCWAIWHMIGGR